MDQQRDLAAERFAALVGAMGITAEAREITGNNALTDEQAVNVIIDARWPDLTEREAHIACAQRYAVELPA